MRRSLLLLLLALLPVPAALATGQDSSKKDAEAKDEKKDDELELTLENLFPEKGMFGPSARGMEFSSDGSHAAWLYRPYVERRHGTDLWVHDLASGETRRVTSVSVMAEFQADTRKVKEHRIEKAREAAKKEKAKKEGDEGDEGEKDDGKDADEKKSEKDGDSDEGGEEEDDEDELGDKVLEDDADDEKAPRYGGVSWFTWSPKISEMLFGSGGDVYRFVPGEEGIERFTMTRGSESSVEYLPDGSGYTYRSGDGLMRVVYGRHHVEQIDPKLESGESLSGYRVSPDGQKLVVLASKGGSMWEGGRKVNIATYEDRFMKVREVNRLVSDDPMPKSETSIYLYRMADPMRENGDLEKVFTYTVEGPRDVLQVPEWAPDSSKVAFAVFEQDTSHVQILEAILPEKDEDDDGDDSDDEGSEEVTGEKESTRKVSAPLQEEEGKKKAGDDAENKEDGPKAKVVYRFLHDGGPNTPRMVQPQYLADSRRLVFLTELSGFRHLHVLDPVYESLQQLTRGMFEVYPLEVSEDREWIGVTSTQEDPSCLDVYRVDLESGDTTRLTREQGRFEGATISPDGNHILANFASYGRLQELVHVDVEGEKTTTLTESHPDKARHFTKAVPEFFSYDNRHGQKIHGNLFKPDGWTEDEKRPLLIYVYGGPLGTRKQVTQGSYSSAGYFFAMYMAKEHGWITCTIDPRGMSGYGAKFEKSNFEQVGKPQVEDLADGVKYLIESHGVDPEKVAIHGWSFGGFQTQMCMYTEPDVFQVGIAGAGPTEWENYNKWYSTGTIGETRDGTPDLKKYSLLPLAENLQGKLLLVHGMEDANVLFQDTIRVYGELLKAGKETLVELFLDPSGGHGLGGHIKTLGRYKKYEEFLLRNLGEGASAQAEEAEQP